MIAHVEEEFTRGLTPFVPAGETLKWARAAAWVEPPNGGMYLRCTVRTNANTYALIAPACDAQALKSYVQNKKMPAMHKDGSTAYLRDMP